MRIKNWKTTIGGSLELLGTTLIGFSVVPSLTSMASAEDTKWITITGFICQALGGFFGHLFAADITPIQKMIDADKEIPQ